MYKSCSMTKHNLIGSASWNVSVKCASPYACRCDIEGDQLQDRG